MPGAFPDFIWFVDIPTRPGDLARRWHNKYAKEALKETIEWYHSKLFPAHYRRDARARYQHFPRTEKYKRQKSRGLKVQGRRYYSTVDHVKTGRSKRRMLREWRLKAGGTAVKGTLHATLILRFDFRGGTGRFRKTTSHQFLTVSRLIIELQRFAPDDPPRLAKKFRELYMRKVEKHQSGRKRRRIS